MPVQIVKTVLATTIPPNPQFAVYDSPDVQQTSRYGRRLAAALGVALLVPKSTNSLSISSITHVRYCFCITIACRGCLAYCIIGIFAKNFRKNFFVTRVGNSNNQR